MNSDNDNSIFFLTISLVCVWLIVDYVVGKQYVGKFISMLPFMGGSVDNDTDDPNTTTDDVYGNDLIDYPDDYDAKVQAVIKKIDNGAKWSDLNDEEKKIAQNHLTAAKLLEVMMRG